MYNDKEFCTAQNISILFGYVKLGGPGWPSQEEEILFCLLLYFFVTPVLGANRSAAAAVSITRTRLIDRSSLAALLYSVRSFTLILRQEQPIYSRSYMEYISPKHLLPSFLLPFYYIELCWLLLGGRLGAASFYFVIYLSSLYAFSIYKSVVVAPLYRRIIVYTR